MSIYYSLDTVRRIVDVDQILFSIESYEVCLIDPIFSYRNWGTNKWNNLCRDTRLLSDKLRLHSGQSSSLLVCFCPPCGLSPLEYSLEWLPSDDSWRSLLFQISHLYAHFPTLQTYLFLYQNKKSRKTLYKDLAVT